MNRHDKRGMTITEVMVATSLLAIVVLMAMSAFAELLATTNSQNALTRSDQIANQALREISTLLRSAVLPVQVGDGKREKDDPFYWVDHSRYGFGKNSWRSALAKGMDLVAFVHPVDAQGANDFLDSKNHVQLGQVRGEYMSTGGTDFQEVVYLSAGAKGTPGTGDFEYRKSATELVCVLAGVKAGDFVKSEIEHKKASSDSFKWFPHGVPSGADVTCFTVIRFVPVMNGAVPFKISEAEHGFDLDGDGETDGEFQIGRLELVYSGSKEGNDFPYVLNGALRSKPVEQTVINLTPDLVLRRYDESEREPIFKLVKPAFNVDPNNEAKLSAMRIRVLLLDSEAVNVEQGGAEDSPTAELVFSRAHGNSKLGISGRWYQTSVVIKNLDR